MQNAAGYTATFWMPSCAKRVVPDEELLVRDVGVEHCYDIGPHAGQVVVVMDGVASDFKGIDVPGDLLDLD